MVDIFENLLKAAAAGNVSDEQDDLSTSPGNIQSSEVSASPGPGQAASQFKLKQKLTFSMGRFTKKANSKKLNSSKKPREKNSKACTIL